VGVRRTVTLAGGLGLLGLLGLTIGCGARGAATESSASLDAGVVATPQRAPRGAEILALVRRASLAPRAPQAIAVATVAARARVATHADGALRLDTAVGALEIAPEGLAHVPAEAVEGASIFADAAPSLDLVELPIAKDARGLGTEGVEELRVLRAPAGPAIARYVVTLGGGLATLRALGDVVEVLDVEGRRRAATEPIVAVDARGARRSARIAIEPLPSSEAGARRMRLVTTLDTTGLVAPIVVDPTWLLLTAETRPRVLGLAAPIPSGAILFGGGASAGATSSDSELYDAATRTFRAGPDRSAATLPFAAVALADGSVLSIGGLTALGGGASVSTVERFDPSKSTWKTVAPMAKPRGAPMAAVLASGKVLVIGGEAGAVGSTCELYDPATDSWKSAGSMAAARAQFGATFAAPGNPAVTLPSGKVLVVGGGPSSAELYDPATDAWSPAGDVTVRAGSVVIGLPSGKVLLAGGQTSMSSPTSYVKEAWLWDPTTRAWTATGAMGVARAFPLAAKFGLGSAARAMVYSGLNDVEFWLSSAEAYDEVAGTWSPLDAATRAHYLGAAVALADGTVLAMGGNEGKEQISTAADLFGKKAGEPCTGAGACLSGFCVDGVCCDHACTGQCEACDLAGALGKCGPVSGSPHGARAACDAGGGSVCAARACDGLLDRSKCVGWASGTATTCNPSHCEGGAFVAAATCDGVGACRTVTPSPCTPYACTDGGCKTTCAKDDDCAATFRCEASRCAPRDATCTADGKSSQPRVGAPVACAPYACDPGPGTCRATCRSSSDCDEGYTCDDVRRECLVPSGATGGSSDGGGCAIGDAGVRGACSAWSGLLAIVGLAGARRRRRAR
jgi:hypothetical protein